MVVAGLLLAAAALWASSRLTWGVELVRHAGTDVPSRIVHTGADTGPLVPLAVLAIAGLAAAFAIGGWARRGLGVLLVAAGLAAAGLGIFASAPAGADFFPWGRILAVLGGVLLIAGGLCVAAFTDRLPRMGARYERGRAVRRPADPDDAMWQALSLGDDPTTDDR
jgi:drug/metabolite transporter superfamily protein YnfA